MIRVACVWCRSLFLVADDRPPDAVPLCPHCYAHVAAKSPESVSKPKAKRRRKGTPTVATPHGPKPIAFDHP